MVQLTLNLSNKYYINIFDKIYFLSSILLLEAKLSTFIFLKKTLEILAKMFKEKILWKFILDICCYKIISHILAFFLVIVYSCLFIIASILFLLRHPFYFFSSSFWRNEFKLIQEIACSFNAMLFVSRLFVVGVLVLITEGFQRLLKIIACIAIYIFDQCTLFVIGEPAEFHL